MRRRNYRSTLVVIAALLVAAPAAKDRDDSEHTDWLARAQDHIAAREYRASENGQGLQAPNRAHNLRTYFEKTGIRVHDRTAPGTPELLRLSLSAVGRGASLPAVPAGEEVVAEDERRRVEIRRPGLVEWYLNSAGGLEQGFTIAERPPGKGSLVLEIAAAGARASLLGAAVVFETGQRKLRFGELAAFDAGEVALAARFELASADRVRIVVDDSDAAYPIVVDPLLTETADTQLESNQSDAQLGTSVAGAGDVNGDGYADVIVGAPGYDAGQNNEGAAFVFHGSASGIANGNPATLESNQASSFGPGETLSTSEFGFTVAGAGDVNGDGYADVIVGAYGYNGDQVDEGSAFVFHGSSAGIANGNPSTAAARLESNQGGGFPNLPPRFGYSVAGAGDVNGDGYSDVIVGSTDYTAGQTQEGAAFVFHGGVGGVGHGSPATAATQLESNVTQADFGWSVASAGDVNADGHADVIVGDPSFGNGQTGEGGAFVFHGSASGIAPGSSATAAAQLESNQAGAALGFGVGGGGDVNGDGYADVIVGAPSYDLEGTDAGAAFVFLGGASGVADADPGTANAELYSNQASAMLGERVAVAGDTNGDGYADVIVGARLYDPPDSNEGAAFVFRGTASGIADGNPSTAAAQLETNQIDAWLWSVAGAGDVNGDGFADVIAGAHLFDNGQSNEGAAFVYLGGAGLVDASPATASSQLESNQASAALGFGVGGGGDLNGDGYGDVIVGAPSYDNGHTDEGAAFVFLGSATGTGDGVPTTADAQLEADQASAEVGWAVAGGDVNGDGFGDVIVGARLYDMDQTDEGAAFVFHGSASGIASASAADATARLETDQANAQLWSVAGAGDVNGDGFTDVIVGSPFYDADQTDEGAAFVFHGSATGVGNGTPATADRQIESNQNGALLGRSVAGAGDTNGDGFSDVIVGATKFDAGGPIVGGCALVFLGSATGIVGSTPAAASILESNDGGSEFGHDVAGAGDVNGDGYADVIVGDPTYEDATNEEFEGGAFVFLGSENGVPTATIAEAAAEIVSNQESAQLGRSVAGAGDVNGDGYADLLVGAPFYTAGHQNEGVAFVFLGSATGIADGSPLTAAAQLDADQPHGRVGWSVAGAGDVNGDGVADVITGAILYDSGQTDEGAGFVFHGNGDGRPVLARQRRGNGETAVPPFGLSQSTTGFVVELRASHPAGRGRVKAEFQACPPAVPFGDGACTTLLSPSWLAVNGATPELLISETFSGLTNDTLYRWRARILHAPATGPIPVVPFHSPWRRLGAQSVEGDIRLPEPALLLSLATGAALIAAIARRRNAANRV